MTQAPTDFIGQEIRAGDEIVYGSLLGRSGAISRGTVLEIIEGEPDYRGNPTFKLKIQRKHSDGSLIMKTKFVYDKALGTGHSEVVGPSTSTLNFPSRMVVINNQLL